MTPMTLSDGTVIEVPSLGFGPRWRPARRALSRLHRLRSMPAAPWRRIDALFFLLGIEREEHDLLEAENALWRELFTACQARAGYTPRECRRLLDEAVSYADRHVYEQFLLFGEAVLDFRGIKKNASPAPTASGSASGSTAASNGSASSISASSRRGSSPRPTSISSAPPTGTKPPSGRCLPFWIRRSPRPATTPAPPSSATSDR